MSTVKKEMNIDRIEDGIAVAYDRSGNEYTMCVKIADIKENDIVEASVNEHGQIVDLVVLSDKAAAIKRSLKDRLRNLFNR